MAKLRSRFTGRRGKPHLIEELKKQVIVAGNEAIALAISKKVELKECPSGKLIVTQGEHDNDLYLILCGSVKVIINGRQIAVRTQGNHVGEIALIDLAKKRTASLETSEHSLVAKISEFDLSRIANTYPEIWRRIAVEISNRLGERNKFIKPPNSQPVIFIGSSSEGIQIAERLADKIGNRGSVIKMWSKNVFNQSNTAIEDLTKIASDTDFCLIVVTPDDKTISRGKKKDSPRDNLIFEMGLFMGAIGRDRTFIVAPKKMDFKIPSDLFGVNFFTFDQSSSKRSKSLDALVKKFKAIVKERGPK